MQARQMVLIAGLIVGLGMQSYAGAETREECYRRIGRQTNAAIGAGTGGVAGGVLAPVVCTVLVAAAFLDGGLSYAICVAAVTTAGSIAGTALAETHNNQQENECDVNTSAQITAPAPAGPSDNHLQ